MFMFPFKVVNGNECLLITNRDELEKFIAFAQTYLSLPIMAIETETQQAAEQSNRNREAAEQTFAIAPSDTSDQPGDKTYNVNDTWIKKSWEAVGQPVQGATNRELYNAALKLGYKSGAQDTVNAFKTAIRISDHMVRIGMRDNLALWKWTETPQKSRRTKTRKVSAAELQSLREASASYLGPADLNLRNPPVGERAIDFAVRALKETGHPLTTSHLAAAMSNLGWQTSGDPLETLASTLRKSRYGDIVTNQKGFWVLVGKESVNEQPGPSNETLELDDLDDFLIPDEEHEAITQT